MTTKKRKSNAGRPASANPNTTSISTRVPEDTATWVAEQAERFQVDMSVYLRWLLTDARKSSWIPPQFSKP